MRPFSQKQPFETRDVLIQGNSVRQIWGVDDPMQSEARRPIRRDPPLRAVPAPSSNEVLHQRLGEELDYVRRMLDAMGDQLAGDPILIRRHAVALQSLDIIGQILSHVGNIIRSGDPQSAVEEIGMSDLRARLTRRPSL